MNKTNKKSFLKCTQNDSSQAHGEYRGDVDDGESLQYRDHPDAGKNTDVANCPGNTWSMRFKIGLGKSFTKHLEVGLRLLLF